MSTICNYAVLRFQPYPETGEFVNLGIVMLCSNGLFFEKVETKTHARVTHFFEKLPLELFRRARKSFHAEIKRVKQMIDANRNDQPLQLALFNHLTRPSETMFRFSKPGTIATEDPMKALDKLFNDYVHHGFANRPDAEAKLKQQLNTLLRKQFPDRLYQEERLGNTDYSVNFPFVWTVGQTAQQAIRPLSFNLEDPKSIIDKGDKWINQMKRLNRYGVAAENTFFICEPPAEDGQNKITYFHEITSELAAMNSINVIPHIQSAKNISKVLA